MPITKITIEDAKNAAAHLSKKTDLLWTVRSTNDTYELVFSEQNADAEWKKKTERFTDRLKEANKIEFTLNVAKPVNEGNSVTATISHPLEILAMAANNFSYPMLTDDDYKQTAQLLETKTGLKWEVKGKDKDGKPLNLLHYAEVIYHGEDNWQKTEDTFKAKFASVDSVLPHISLSERGVMIDQIVFTVAINPFDIQTLLLQEAKYLYPHQHNLVM